MEIMHHSKHVNVILTGGDDGSLCWHEPVVRYASEEGLQPFLKEISTGTHALDTLRSCEVFMNENGQLELHGKLYNLSKTGFSDLCRISAISGTNVYQHIENGCWGWVNSVNEYLNASSLEIKPIVRNGLIVALRSPVFALVTNEKIVDVIIKNRPADSEFLGAALSAEKMSLYFIDRSRSIKVGGIEHNITWSLSNSEIGYTTLSFSWGTFTEACTNLSVWGGMEMGKRRRRHRGSSMAELAPIMLGDFMCGIDEATNNMQKLLPRMETAALDPDCRFFDQYFAKVKKLIGVVDFKGFEDLRKLKFKGKTTLYDEWCFETEFAQSVKDPIKRSAMEEIGGWMMSMADGRIAS